MWKLLDSRKSLDESRPAFTLASLKCALHVTGLHKRRMHLVPFR
jgi:hypothetical protein